MEVKLPEEIKEIMSDRPIDQPTDGRTDRLIGKFHFQTESKKLKLKT